MDVYLIPVGSLTEQRYELYCEHQIDEDGLDPAPAGGRVARMVNRFKATVAEAEREHQSGRVQPISEGAGWQERLKRKTLRWIAERVAEQRLLWRLRKESQVTLFYANDLSGEDALAFTRSRLQREADRHLKWSVIDGLLLAASAIVAIIPGPNPVAYYFGFRFFGHLFSWRGAKHALNDVRWDCRPSAELTRLRQAAGLAAAERRRHVHEVALALRLEHLTTFFERTAVPAA